MKYTADGIDVRMQTGSISHPSVVIAYASSASYAQRIVELLNQADPPAETGYAKGRGC